MEGLPKNISWSTKRSRYIAYAQGKRRKQYVGAYKTLEAACEARDRQQAICDLPDMWDISKAQIHKLSQHPYAVKKISRDTH